jgi:hypothetical protein
MDSSRSHELKIRPQTVLNLIPDGVQLNHVTLDPYGYKSQAGPTTRSGHSQKTTVINRSKY